MTLATSEVLSHIGRIARYPPATQAIGRAAIQAFVDSLHGRRDSWLPDESNCDEVAEMPPMMLCDTNQHYTGSNLRAGCGHDWQLPLPSHRMIRVSNAYEFTRLATEGDVVSVEWELCTIEERPTRQGIPTLFVASDATYRVAEGEILAVNHETVAFQRDDHPLSTKARPLPVDGRTPVMTRTLTAEMLMGYGASTWDWNPIHYSADFARRRGFDAPIVDGGMYGAIIGERLRDWGGRGSRLLAATMRYFVPAYVGSTVEVYESLAHVQRLADGAHVATMVHQVCTDTVLHGQVESRLLVEGAEQPTVPAGIEGR